MADLLIRAGARVAARTREGVTPLQLAATNGSAPMIDRLLKAGADPNAALTPARRHGADDGGADGEAGRDSRARGSGRQRQREGDLGRHDGADVGGVRRACRRRQAAARRLAPTSTRARTTLRRPTAAGSRGARRWRAGPSPKVEEFASGWLTPLMLAAREGDVELTRILVERGRRRQRGRRRRQDGVGPGDLQRQLRGGVVPGRRTRPTSTRPTRSGSRRCSGPSIAATWKRRRTSRGWSRPIRCRSSASCSTPARIPTRSSTTRRARGCARALRALSSPPR